ncbi:MAG: tetratricopeptide repeat protein [Planctomycetes bacterium]|nr:tetratricopeptide repeat protein [Planctomycetota bacterium]
MARPNSISVLTLCFGSVLLLALSGCGGLDSTTRRDLDQAETNIARQPAAALETLNRLASLHPNETRILHARARALEGVGDWPTARDAWLDLLTRVDADDEGLTTACHRGIGRSTLEVLGVLPAEYQVATGEEVPALETAARSFRTLLEGNPGDPAALLGLAQCEHRLGAHAVAMGYLRSIPDSSPEHDPARYLELRIRETLVGLSPEWVQELSDLMTCQDEATRLAAARQLVAVASREGIDPRVQASIRDQLTHVRQLPEVPTGLVERIETFEREEVERKRQEQVTQLIEFARAARRRGDWREGWDALQRAIQISPSAKVEVPAHLNEWGDALATRIQSDLREGRIDLAAKTRETLKTLDASSFGPDLRQRLDALDAEFEEAWRKHGVGVAMQQATSRSSVF